MGKKIVENFVGIFKLFWGEILLATVITLNRKRKEKEKFCIKPSKTTFKYTLSLYIHWKTLYCTKTVI